MWKKRGRGRGEYAVVLWGRERRLQLNFPEPRPTSDTH